MPSPAPVPESRPSGGNEAPEAPRTAPASDPPRRHRVLRASAFLLVLGILLAAAEYASTLWLGHRSTHYIVPGTSNGSPAWVDNPAFALRFALPRAAGLPPPMAAVRDSEDRAYRVAVLTDSTPLGPSPDSADFSFPRQLEVLLRARLPGLPVEVLHLTVPSANSHVLREIARDLPLLRPDAVVVVCGNDEIAGPCGPAAPAALGPAPWPLHPGPAFARPFVLFSRLRLAQALAALAVRLAPDRADRAVWTTFEPQLATGWLPPDAPSLADAREAYSDNLDAIFALAAAASPTVIACTTPVNLRDCPPVASVWSADPDTAQLDREALFRASANETLYPDEAARLCDAILLRTPGHAEALYLSGRLALRRGHPDLAARQLSAARDNDLFRRRCDSTFNLLLANAADRAEIHLLDAAALFAGRAPDGVPGNEYFLDPVHMTFEGHHLLASAILDTLSALDALPDGPTADLPSASGSGDPPALPGAADLADAMLYHPWGRAADLAATLSALRTPPYRDLSFQSAAVARISGEKTTADSQAAALANLAPSIYARRLAAAPNDARLPRLAAVDLLRAGHPSDAAAPAAAAAAAWPHRPDIRAIPILIDLLPHNPDAAAEAELDALRASDSGIAENEKRLRELNAAEDKAKRRAVKAHNNASNLAEDLKDRINEDLTAWVESLPDDDLARTDVSWPVSLVQAVRSAKVQAVEAATRFDAASNALATAEAELAAVQAELDEANRKAEAATAEFKASQAATEKARSAGGSGDSLAAAQTLTDLIRKTDRLQSMELAALTSARMIAQRIPPLQAARDARPAEFDTERADLDLAARRRGGAIRDLRMVWLGDREKLLADIPADGGGDREGISPPGLWGPPYPGKLALKARGAARDEEAMQTEYEAARTARRELEAARTARLRGLRKNISNRIFAETLPRFLSHGSPGDGMDESSALPRPTPTDLAAAHALGTALSARSLHSLAVPWFSWILDNAPDRTETVIALADALRELGYGDEALSVLRAASDRLPSDPDLLEALGYHFCLLRNGDASDACYERADRIVPYRDSRFLRRARGYREFGHASRTWRTLQQYLEFHPGDPVAQAEVAPIMPSNYTPEEKTPAPPKPSLLDALKE